MPSIEKHVEISRRRTGKDYLDLHEWIDKDPATKVERHDITKIYEYGKMMDEKYGPEGLQEYLQHIHDDFVARFNHVKEDVDKAIAESLSYFGVKPPVNGVVQVEYQIQETDVQLLREAGVAPDDVNHCLKVAHKALDLAKRAGAPVDLELVGRGGLFHDLGKAKARGDDHGVVGAEIGRKLKLPDAIIAIMEKHVKGGLTEDEAREAGLPAKDYSATTLEEKTVIYADKLVDIISSPAGIVSNEQEAEDRFVEILRAHPQLAKGEKPLGRLVEMRTRIQSLIKGK
ncbi:MAG: HDIG domain-containing metalloprotein [Thermodesulfobacteriota bacterium]